MKKKQYLSTAFFALCCSLTTHAAYFADSVVSYTSGTNATSSGSFASYQNPSAALGSVAPITGVGSPYASVVSPFDPSYDTDQIVELGKGGQITLHLSRTLNVGAGYELGVFTGVGLVDTSYGTTGNPVTEFSAYSATVQVSLDGTNWVSLGLQNFTIPSNYYNSPTTVGPYDASAPAGTATSDFGKPFTGSLADFNGKNTYADVLAVLNGSGGGTWLSLSSTGLSQVNYVRFTNDINATTNFVLDAVSVNNASAAPEPGPTSLLTVGLFLWLVLQPRRKVRLQ